MKRILPVLILMLVASACQGGGSTRTEVDNKIIRLTNEHPTDEPPSSSPAASSKPFLFLETPEVRLGDESIPVAVESLKTLGPAIVLFGGDTAVAVLVMSILEEFPGVRRALLSSDRHGAHDEGKARERRQGQSSFHRGSLSVARVGRHGAAPFPLVEATGSAVIARNMNSAISSLGPAERVLKHPIRPCSASS